MGKRKVIIWFVVVFLVVLFVIACARDHHQNNVKSETSVSLFCPFSLFIVRTTLSVERERERVDVHAHPLSLC